VGYYSLKDRVDRDTAATGCGSESLPLVTFHLSERFTNDDATNRPLQIEGARVEVTQAREHAWALGHSA